MHQIYTIIVTYNPLSWIDECLRCLKGSTVDTNIIIVDNNSTDGARNYLPKTYPEIIWLPQEKNLGFGQANNLGIKYALEHDADYVFLLNQDAYVFPDTIEKILNCSDGKSVMSPIHMNSNASALDQMFKCALRNSDLSLLDDILAIGKIAPSYSVPMVNAACWMIPRFVLENVGGFNPVFFHYGEDNNYCQRLNFYGIKLKIVVGSKICHDRNVHGNVEVFNKKKLWRDMMLIECDVNNSGLKRFVKYAKLLKKLYCKDVVHGAYKPFTFFMYIIKIYCMCMIFRKIREKDSCPGLNWLNKE